MLQFLLILFGLLLVVGTPFLLLHLFKKYNRQSQYVPKTRTDKQIKSSSANMWFIGIACLAVGISGKGFENTDIGPRILGQALIIIFGIILLWHARQKGKGIAKKSESTLIGDKS